MFVRQYSKLKNLHGSAFDAAFTMINKRGHMMVMQACNKELRAGHDAGVRSYATEMLATARSHQMMVLNRTTMMANRGSYGTAAQPMKP